MKIKIYSMNLNGCSTEFSVDGKNFATSQYGDGLYYQGFGKEYNNHIMIEIMPPEFFSLNQDTKSGRWKAIKREFAEHGDYIKSYIEHLGKERNHERNKKNFSQHSPYGI